MYSHILEGPKNTINDHTELKAESEISSEQSRSLRLNNRRPPFADGANGGSGTQMNSMMASYASLAVI